MERIGILVVSYGSRGAAIIDALYRSEKFEVDIFVVDKQKNPFNVSKAKIHTVIPDLDIKKICKFAKKNDMTDHDSSHSVFHCHFHRNQRIK